MVRLARYMLGKDTEPIPEPPEDYIFNFPRAYAVETWQQYRNHGTLPRAGGWDDQPAGLVSDDWGYLNWVYAYASQEVDDNDRKPQTKQTDLNPLINDLSGGKPAFTWSQIRDQS